MENSCSDSGVEGIVVNSLSVAESEKDSLTLYVKYTKSGITEGGTQLTKFKNNEILVEKGQTTHLRYFSLNATTYTGSIAYLTEGVYYIRGYFVQVEDSFVILDQYTNKPTYKVGLTITEEIVSSNEDTSLFDNANGSTNFAAPGADRLKISATLSKDIITFSDNSDFIELLRLQNGTLQELVETSVYNELEKNLARRTFDESGDYTLTDFTFKVYETLDTGKNGGIYPINTVIEDGRTILNRTPLATDPENSIDGRNFYTIEVSPGKAYVRGFEINNVAKRYVTVEKPRSSFDVNNKATNIDFGNYFEFTSVSGGTVTLNEQLSLRNASSVNIGLAKAIGISGSRLYLSEVTTYTVVTATATSTNLVEGDFVFSSKGSRAVVNSATVSGSTLTIELRQVNGKFALNDVVTNSRDDVSLTLTQVTDYNISDIRSIINGTGFDATISAAGAVLKSKNKNFYVSASGLPVKSVDDFAYVKLDKVTKTVSNNEVSISAPNNYTVLSTGFTIISSGNGVHTATASINGNTLTLSNITPSVTGAVDIYYKLRVNNTASREKTPQKFTFLSLPNKKNRHIQHMGIDLMTKKSI